jgi:protein-disulfide isomerase
MDFMNGENQNLNNQNDQNNTPEAMGLSKQDRRRLKKERKQKEKTQAKRKKTAKKLGFWFLSLVIIGGVVFGIIMLGKNASTPLPAGQTLPTGDEQTTLIEARENDWTKGNPDSGITLIEYSDFQCPACASYSPVLEKLVEDEGDNFLFVYRHFPLTQAHPKAELAAQAAEAAGRQNNFWEMHNLLFERQNEWPNTFNTKSKFVEYARELGLDTEQFESDIDSDEVKNKVNQNSSEARTVGLLATPSFILNGKFIQNPQNLSEFKTLIQNAKK